MLLTKPKKRRDPNQPYLAILVAKIGQFQTPHAGIARHGQGTTLCNDALLPVFWLPQQDPNFSLLRPDGWRHRYAEAFLERNDGCQHCLNALYALGRELGYAHPKGLAA